MSILNEVEQVRAISHGKTVKLVDVVTMGTTYIKVNFTGGSSLKCELVNSLLRVTAEVKKAPVIILSGN